MVKRLFGNPANAVTFHGAVGVKVQREVWTNGMNLLRIVFDRADRDGGEVTIFCEGEVHLEVMPDYIEAVEKEKAEQSGEKDNT